MTRLLSLHGATSRLRLYRWQIRHAVRMVTASVTAYALVFALGLDVDFSAVITAIIVTQSNIGGSFRMAVEQLFASVVGAACGVLAVLALHPQDPVIGAAALVLALVPLAILGALSPGYRMAPISAVIVLLGGPGPDAEVLSQGLDRVLGVAIGCGAGVLVSMLVLPARASRAAVTTAGEIAQLMADQLRALTSGGSDTQSRLVSLSADTREKLILLSELVDEAARERRIRVSAIEPDGPRLLRTLRRLRHDLDSLRRALREAGSDALHECVAAPWRRAADAGAATLDGIARIIDGQRAEDDLPDLGPAVRDYLNALEEIRVGGLAFSLSPAALRRMFGIGFALDQFRRDLDDMVEVACEARNRQPRRLMKG